VVLAVAPTMMGTHSRTPLATAGQWIFEINIFFSMILIYSYEGERKPCQKSLTSSTGA
jgi:hypothetical protein